MASSSLLCNQVKASGRLQLVNPMIDRLAVGRTLRNRAFVATTLHMNLIYDITLRGLVLQSVCFVGPGLGGAGLWSANSCQYRPQCTPRRNALHRAASSSTAPACTSKCPSWLPCERMAAARQRGLTIFLNTFSYFPHQSMEDATDSKTGVNHGVRKLEAIIVILGEMTAKNLTSKEETKCKK